MKVRLMTEELIYLYQTPIDEIKGKQSIPKSIIKQYKKRIELLRSIVILAELNEIGGLNFEKLKGNLKEYYSIRLNRQYRLIFRVKSENEESIKIEIISS